MLFSLTMLMIGGVLALGIRAELFQPGLQYLNPELFNQFTTMHGIIMVFGAIMPAFVGFANWMIPLQIGASDMAFARMNNFSFWLLIPAALLLVASFFLPGGAPAAGWTLYAPLTLQMGPSMDAGIFAMHIMGASSIMGSINIVVNELNSSGLKNCRPGWNSSARMHSARTPPIISIANENSRYIVPMSLWFVAKTQRRQPLSGP